MAPAAQYHKPQSTTVIHSQPSARAAAQRDVVASKSVEKQTRTQTVTRTSTIFLDDSLSPSLSTGPATSTHDWSRPSGAIKPHIYGIDPGDPRRALHLNWHSPPFSTPNSATIATSHRPTECFKPAIVAARRSNYPLPSPPGFLYPFAIVPVAAHVAACAAQQENLMERPEHDRQGGSPYHPRLLGRMDYELAYLAPGYKILFVGSIAMVTLGVIWAMMVWLVNFPPGTWEVWDFAEKKKIRSGKEAKEEGEEEKERRPVDKPSKYAPRETKEIEAMMVKTDGGAVTPTAGVPFKYRQQNAPVNNGHVDGEQGIELKYRPKKHTTQHRRQHTQIAPHTDFIYTSHRRVSSPPSAGSRFIITPTTSTLSSSPNPFLKPPGNGFLAAREERLTKRSSTEWLAEHERFFSASHSSSSSSFSSPSMPSYSLATADIEALEAGTAPPTGRTHAYSSSSSFTSTSSSKSTEGGMLRKSLSWLDQGLGLVDEAVSSVASGITRWTDDGGLEGEVLPIARAKGVKLE
ncbi:hypothetical protein EJ02DRAFT_510558 [Clathrospora elynae]|uniref:Uncharacterized protein n=1 Tax=Clathrospora elynae TaxID=706981 RepID=A0A6A5SVZ9_9PLEO|nr:hypothetical protein EJ02DRAFT_510558 [Clathrospora elynae]